MATGSCFSRDLRTIQPQERVHVSLQEPWEDFSPLAIQDEVTVGMREAVADWLLAVSTELEAELDIFCLAVSCLDRFLSRVTIKRQQLQLVAVACLLVAWKVRGSKELAVDTLVKFTGNSILQQEILECELLILTKLNWNLPSVVALDYLEQIIQGVSRAGCSQAEVRRKTTSHILSLYLHPSTAARAPSLLAAAAAVLAIRPMLSSPPPPPPPPPVFTPPSSSCSPPLLTTSCSPPLTSTSSSSSLSSSPDTSSTTSFRTLSATAPQPVPSHSRERRRHRKSSSINMDKIIRSVQRVTLSERTAIESLLEEVGDLQAAHSLPLTPSPESRKGPAVAAGAAESGCPMARDLFPDSVDQTPTKLLDASASELV